MRRIFSFLLGAIAGSLVGTVLAMLLAPAPGTDTRRMLSERFTSMIEDVKSAASARRVELEQQLNQLRAPHKND